jgi:CheY-like chemotaxis protein
MPLDPRSVKRPCILLVEDDDDVSAMLVETLLAADYDVVLARNGVEGLGRLGEGTLPKLILLDWSMPIMSGPEMYAAMQAQPAWRELPVVLLTAHGDAKNKAIALRASGYLKKPIDSDDLIRMVSALVREHTSLRLRRTSLERDPTESTVGPRTSARS